MQPIILCVDDQRDVLVALKRDLEPLEDKFEIVTSESASEACELLEDFDSQGRFVALAICDHIMPGKNGVRMLSELANDGRFSGMRKLLLTGLASHQDTIEAINSAKIDCYVEKPWKQDDLMSHIKRLLTHAILDAGLVHAKFAPHMDAKIVIERMRNKF